MSIYPFTLTMSVKIKDEAQAQDIVASLIDWERKLRGANRGLPITAKIKLAHSLAEVRRKLQETAGLVVDQARGMVKPKPTN